MSTIEDYLDKATPTQKAEFERIRKIVRELAPEAEEVMSYGIPTFKHKRRPLIYFGAFKDHMSIFPASDEMMETIPELSKFRTSKGTLRYTEDNLIPDSLVKKFIRYNSAELE